MAMIIGMDGGVFLAWILTILSAILCVLYGIYDHFIKKNAEEKKEKPKKTINKSNKKKEK